MPTDAAAILRDSSAASSEDAAALSRKLNKAAAALYIEARSPNEVYFDLFRRVDMRRRGVISFEELYDLIRVLLQVPESRVSDEQIGSLWKWMDKRATATSFVPKAGILKMMRLGWKMAFVVEQARLKNKQRMPDWEPACHRPTKDAPLWDDRSMSFREQAAERDSESKAQPSAAGRRKPLNPAWDATCHKAKDGPLWEDRATTFKEKAAQADAERRGALASFRDSRANARGLRTR